MSISPPAISTPPVLYEKIQFITDNYPETLLVGSLGRAGIYGELLGDAELEYRIRKQLPTRKALGAIADLDLINMSVDHVPYGQLLPFHADLKSFDGKQVSIKLINGDWVLRSLNRGFRANVDERVMEPILATTVYGARCRTLHPQTHLALLGLMGTIRPQDMIAQDALIKVINLNKSTRLPRQLYEPFVELAELNYKSSFTTARRLYRATLPAGLRKALAPTMQKVKDYHLK